MYIYVIHVYIYIYIYIYMYTHVVWLSLVYIALASLKHIVGSEPRVRASLSGSGV